MQPLAWNFENPMGFRTTSKLAEGFFKPDNLFFDIHGILGKHLKPFDHKIGPHWWGLAGAPELGFPNDDYVIHSGKWRVRKTVKLFEIVSFFIFY